MFTLGVMSDTHGNRRLMHRAAEAMQASGAQVIVHLGDNFEDAQELEMTGYTVWSVPGLWCEAYRSGRIPRVRTESCEGAKIVFAHASQDLRGAVRGAQIVLIGHTHRAGIEEDRGCVYMNPGHLKARVDRGEEASYGIIRIEADRTTFEIHNLDGAVREQWRQPGVRRQCDGD